MRQDHPRLGLQSQSTTAARGHRTANPLAVGITLIFLVVLCFGWEKEDSRAEQPKDKPASEVENPFPNRVKAPSLDGGTEWLNTSGEITLDDLRGKVVLFDFWTYCCINCMHVLPDLKYLERKYANELVVIGVHSAKFDNEKDSENIRQAIVRYEIEHPVINDSEMIIWRKLGARAWPTLVLVDPEGYYCGYISGEGQRELLDAVIGKLVAYHKAKGTLDTTPIRFDLERHKQKQTPLKYPGKVLADARRERLFISDSNHNRIVVASWSGKLLDVIGTGAMGRKDGGFNEATFDHPQGMTLVGERLYVADTENHLIRTVDLKNKCVSTLAGTGQQARFRAPGGTLRKTALNSPWDLLHVDGTLFVAMAGPHQIWFHELGSETIQVFSGSGREDVRNGPHSDAAFAQPSGLATDGEFLYVADSEGSAIRKMSLDPSGTVSTVVGTSDLPNGRSLFEFGDRDGVGSEARLQHPLGVALSGETLFVADTYNHKIKRVSLKERKSTTWLGTGQRGRSVSPPQFFEPAGLAVAAGTLFVADTNNHRICTVDVKSGATREFTIEGLRPPNEPAATNRARELAGAAPVEVKPQTVAASDMLEFEVKFDLPKGFKINKRAPLTCRLKAEQSQNLIAADQLEKRHKAKLHNDSARIQIPLAKQEGTAVFEVSLRFSYCRDGVGGLCKLKTVRWRVPVTLASSAKQTQIPLVARAAQ